MKLVMVICLMIASTQTFARGRDIPSEQRTAFYVVPVEPADLIRYAIFSNIDIETKNHPDGTVEMEYILPLELTGAENKLEFSGKPNPDGTLYMTGPHGSANCKGGARIGRCEMNYKNLIFDKALREELLKQIAKSNPEELLARINVATQFENMVNGQPAIQTRLAFFRNNEIHGILEVQ